MQTRSQTYNAYTQTKRKESKHNIKELHQTTKEKTSKQTNKKLREEIPKKRKPINKMGIMISIYLLIQFSSVQSFSHVRLLVTQ